MYAVTCSACRAVEKSPFARVGAAMRCPACGAVSPLRQENIKHQVRLKLEGDEELFKVAVPPPAPTGVAVPPPPPAPTPLELLSTTVDEPLSLVPPPAPQPEPAHNDAGLQLAAEAERIAEAARRRRPPAGRPPGREPAISGAEMAARMALQRKRKTFTAVAAMTLLVLGAVAAIVLLNMGGDPGESSEGGDAVATDNPGNGDGRDPHGTDPNPPPVKPPDPVNPPVKPPADPLKPPVDPVPPQPPIVPPTLRVTADPLPGDAWRPAAGAFRPEPSDAAIALADEVRTDTAAGLVFTANLVSRTAVSSALLTVFLVNDEDRVYARLEHPAVLIEDRKPRPVRFVVPPAMRAGLSTLHCSLQSLDAGVKNLVVYEDGLVEPLAGEEQVLKISAFNGSDTSLKQSVFALQLLDAEGYAVQQWRLPYGRPAGAKGWVKFEAKLPIKPPAGAKWRVYGAGLSDAAAVVPPPVKPSDTPGPDPNERELPRPRGGGKGLFDF